MNQARRVAVLTAWNQYIDQRSRAVLDVDRLLARVFPLVEALAAANGWRVPGPWDRNPPEQWVRYWRVYAWWRLNVALHGRTLRRYRKALKPPLGFLQLYP